MTRSSSSVAQAATPGSGTEAAARVADVLLLFLRRPACGVSVMARELRLSKAVVHRILQSLESRSIIAYDDEQRVYRLGPGIAVLGARALGNLDLRKAAIPVLHRLARETGETATLSTLTGSSRIYIDQVPSSSDVKMTVEIGRPFPLHAGASSRAILAFAPSDLREAVLDYVLTPLTPQTITDRAALEASLAETTRTGIAHSRGERQPGAASVAAALFMPDGEVVGAISVCGPVDRFDDVTVARVSPLVAEAAREISQVLGGTMNFRAPSPQPQDERGQTRG